MRLRLLPRLWRAAATRLRSGFAAVLVAIRADGAHSEFGGELYENPHPGELRQLVEIGRTVHAINENGFPVETEQVVCQVWAKVEDCDSRYFTSGDTENTERGIWFTIRWRNDVQPGMWVQWNRQKQVITEVGEYDFKRRYLRLTTKAVKGVR